MRPKTTGAVTTRLPPSLKLESEPPAPLTAVKLALSAPTVSAPAASAGLGGRRNWTLTTRSGASADAAIRAEDVHVRLPVDWDSVDPIPPALAEIMARPGTVNPPLDDVVPGEPAPEEARRTLAAAGITMIIFGLL